MLVKVVLRRSINIIHEKQNYLSPGGRGLENFVCVTIKFNFLPSLAVAGLSISIVVRGTEISM